MFWGVLRVFEGVLGFGGVVRSGVKTRVWAWRCTGRRPPAHFWQRPEGWEEDEGGGEGTRVLRSDEKIELRVLGFRSAHVRQASKTSRGGGLVSGAWWE